MAESTSNKPSTNIPVRVTSNHTRHPTQPPVALPSLAADVPAPKPAKKEIIKNKFSSVTKPLSEEQRRKIMWVSVAAGTVLIVAGWALFGRVDLSTGGTNSLFSEIKKAFSVFSEPDQQTDNQSQEIRDLTNQVFPQFSTN